MITDERPESAVDEIQASDDSKPKYQSYRRSGCDVGLYCTARSSSLCPWRLNCVESLAAAFDVTGFDAYAERLLSAFGWAESFYEVNGCVYQTAKQGQRSNAPIVLILNSAKTLPKLAALRIEFSTS